MKYIKKESCGGWMIVLFMVMSFIIGCANPYFQDVSFFPTIVFGLAVVMDFSPCLFF